MSAGKTVKNESRMPVLSIFYGMIIRVYYNEHGIPHFHVEHGEKKYVIAIETGKTLHGKLLPRTRKLLEEWRVLHVDELQKAWLDAQKHKEPKKIKPLE